MRRELDYRHSSDPSVAPVILDEKSHDSARRAEWVAEKSELGVQIFSYTDALLLMEEGGDPIIACATLTGTSYDKQLKTVFVADAPLDGQHVPNAALAITKMSDRVDYKKLAEALSSLPGRDKVGSLRSNISGLENLGIVPGRLGINEDHVPVPALFSPGPSDTYKPYTDRIGSVYVVDQSIKKLPKFCMLAGYGEADALIVVDGQGAELGDRFDAFWANYFGGTPHIIADILKS